MTTESKITANRNNAARSTGPRTKLGAQRSRSNAVKHGLTAKTLVVEGEDAEGFKRLADEHMAVFRPRDAVELEFAQKFSIAAWQHRRCASAETAMANQHIREAQAEADLAQQQEVLKLGERLFFDRDGLWQRHPDPSTNVIPKSGRGNPHFPDPDSPARLVNLLEASLEGCRWLLDRWNELRVRNQPGNSWQAFDKLKCIRLLGKEPLDVADEISGDIAIVFLATHVISPTSKNPFAELRCDVEVEWFHALLKRLEGRQVERLRPENEAEARQLLNNLIDHATSRLEKLAALHQARAEADAAERTSRLAFDPRPAADKVRRYKLASAREMSRACRDLLMLRKSGMFDEPDQPDEPACLEPCAQEALGEQDEFETDLPSTCVTIECSHDISNPVSPAVREEPPASTENGDVQFDAATPEPGSPTATQASESTLPDPARAVDGEPPPCETDYQSVSPSSKPKEEGGATSESANLEPHAPLDQSGSLAPAQPSEPAIHNTSSAVCGITGPLNLLLLVGCFWWFVAGGERVALNASQLSRSAHGPVARRSPIEPSVGPHDHLGTSAQGEAVVLSTEIEGSADEAELCAGINEREGACPAGPIHRTMGKKPKARNEPTAVWRHCAGSSGQVGSALMNQSDSTDPIRRGGTDRS